jgi:hypothetical protein
MAVVPNRTGADPGLAGTAKSSRQSPGPATFRSGFVTPPRKNAILPFQVYQGWIGPHLEKDLS